MRSIAIVLALLIAAPAMADKRAEREARTLFKEGNRLAEEGDFEGAAEMYQSAYDRFPNYKILVNLGRVLEQLGRDIEAAETYEKILAHEEVKRGRQAKIKDKLAEIEARLGRLRVEVDQTGAQITLDGKPAGTSDQPLAIRVRPGTHAVIAEKEGFLPAAETVNVEAGSERVVALNLRRADEPVAAPAPVPEPTLAEPVEPAAPSRADAEVEGWIEPEEARISGLSHAGQIGLVLRSETDLRDAEVGPTAGLTLGVGDWIELSAVALIQRSTGARVAGSLLLRPEEALKPFLRLGVPMFFEGGTHAGFHGGGGVGWDFSRNLGIAIDLAIEHFPDLGGDAYTAALIGLGVQARGL